MSRIPHYYLICWYNRQKQGLFFLKGESNLGLILFLVIISPDLKEVEITLRFCVVAYLCHGINLIIQVMSHCSDYHQNICWVAANTRPTVDTLHHLLLSQTCVRVESTMGTEEVCVCWPRWPRDPWPPGRARLLCVYVVYVCDNCVCSAVSSAKPLPLHTSDLFFLKGSFLRGQRSCYWNESRLVTLSPHPHSASFYHHCCWCVSADVDAVCFCVCASGRASVV